MAVISRVSLIKGGWVAGGSGDGKVATGLQTPRGTPSSNHMPNQSQTTTEYGANVWEMIWVHAILLKLQRSLIICTGFSVFCIAKIKPVQKSRLGYLLLLLINYLYEIIILYTWLCNYQPSDDITKYKSKGHIIVDIHTQYCVGLAGLYIIISTTGS